MTYARWLILAFTLSVAPLVWAQAEAAGQAPAEQAPPGFQTEPQQPPLVLRELLVIQTDRYDDTANNAKLQTTALPANVGKTGREKRVDQKGRYDFSPMPLGLLTFEGVIEESMKLRLEIVSPAGQFLAYFPDTDAIVGKQSLGWETIRQAEGKRGVEPFGEQGAWLETLRESEDRLWIQSRDPLRKERFFLYDASFRFKPGIDVAIKENRYVLKTNVPDRAAPPLSLLLHRKDSGWFAGSLAAPWSGTTPTIAAKADESTPTIELLTALAPIKELLTDRGYNAQEINLALNMIASAGVDTSSMSLVYVLPVGIIDEYIQLKIKPTPDKVIRTAIIVVNNVDPDLGSQVNALLDDLGSDQWIKRDRAQRELINLGQAAIKKVQQLKDDKDPEVAFRARQILNAYDWKMGGNK